MEAAAQPVSPARLVVPALVGAAVAVALGVYGNAHDPTGESILGDGLFFSATLNMKAWLATAVVLLACVQVFTALWMYGRLAASPRARHGCRPSHRVSGTLAFLDLATGRLPLPLGARLPGHRHAGARPLARRLLLLRRLHREDALAAGRRPARARCCRVVGGAVFTSLVVIWLTQLALVLRQLRFPELLGPAAESRPGPILGGPDDAARRTSCRPS